MKQTIYFVSTNFAMHQLGNAISDVTNQRIKYIEDNKAVISNIDEEDLKIVSWNQNRSNVMVVLCLSFYNK